MTNPLSLEDALDLAVRVLQANNVSRGNAESVAKALVSAEADGQKGHGLSRLPSYAAQAKSGKVDGFANPQAQQRAQAAIMVDAAHGFAYPAFDLARQKLEGLTPQTGIAAAGLHRSHHFGQAGYHAEQLAEAGLLALIMGNSPQAIAPWGGTKGVFGTNPLALAVPRAEQAPLVIDLSLSKVARGKIMAADKVGEAIPEGWALDSEGKPTTDPKAALAGTMIPIGDAKGVALAMMVEIMAVSLMGANHGFEASSFFTADGPPPAVGQLIIAFHPGAFAGALFDERLECLIAAIESQDGTRLPGTRRFANRDKAKQNGINLPPALQAEIEGLL